ncbi:MAG: SAM-dependent methyltransferase [Planctomycetota bacterium]
MPAAPDLAAATCAYLAADGLLEPLCTALGDDVVAVRDRLVLARRDAPEAACWAANVWHDLQQRSIESIGDGARWLRSMQRNWALYSLDHHRRAALLEEKLPPLRPKPLGFPTAAPTAPLGSWTLWRPDLLLASARCSSPFRHGEVAFVEDKLGPPSRAYLKLWEALTLLRRWPAKGERCVDLGASPGGWTWVLGNLGADVLAIDKAPLDPAVAAMPGVTTRRESAFALAPEAVGPVDWLFSDVICYPERLLDLVERWRRSGLVRHFVCTVKFQGAEHHAAARSFAAIPGSRLVHLHHNRHELTWMLTDAAADG